jgi:hypothetical protein
MFVRPRTCPSTFKTGAGPRSHASKTLKHHFRASASDTPRKHNVGTEKSLSQSAEIVLRAADEPQPIRCRIHATQTSCLPTASFNSSLAAVTARRREALRSDGLLNCHKNTIVLDSLRL